MRETIIYRPKIHQFPQKPQTLPEVFNYLSASDIQTTSAGAGAIQPLARTPLAHQPHQRATHATTVPPNVLHQTPLAHNLLNRVHAKPILLLERKNALHIMKKQHKFIC